MITEFIPSRAPQNLSATERNWKQTPHPVGLGKGKGQYESCLND